MKRKIVIFTIGLLIAIMMSAVPSFAQDRGPTPDADTMRVMGADETPDEIEQRLTVPDSALEEELALPESAADKGKERSAYGMDTANQAREQKSEFGRERSREARETIDERPGDHIREQVRDRLTDRERPID